MKPVLKYIELKSGYSDDGPAWIGYVEFSKSGQTVYFNNMAIQTNGHGAGSNLENGDIYWVSGVKKEGTNRHIYGKGKIFIDRNAIEEYLNLTGQSSLDLTKFLVVDIAETDKSRFNEMVNKKI
jgi:hypothetical protein